MFNSYATKQLAILGITQDIFSRGQHFVLLKIIFPPELGLDNNFALGQ